MRVKCLAKEHNTMFPARAQTPNACSRVKHTNHEAIATTETRDEREVQKDIL